MSWILKTVSGPDSGPDCLKTNSGPDSGPECLMMPQMCMALTSQDTFSISTAMKGYEGHAAWKKDLLKRLCGDKGSFQPTKPKGLKSWNPIFEPICCSCNSFQFHLKCLESWRPFRAPTRAPTASKPIRAPTRAPNASWCLRCVWLWLHKIPSAYQQLWRAMKAMRLERKTYQKDCVETKVLSNQQSLKVWKAGILYLNQFAVHITVFSFIWNVVNPEDRFGPRLLPIIPGCLHFHHASGACALVRSKWPRGAAVTNANEPKSLTECKNVV